MPSSAPQVQTAPVRVKRGDEVTVTIESLADRGMGLARIQGMVCFVPYAVPGDRLKVVIQHAKRGYAEASIVDVLGAGPARVTPSCRYFGECGGCALQHVDYVAQLKAKKDSVVAALRSLKGEWAHVVRDPLPSVARYRYRTKMEFSFNVRRWLTREEIASKKPLDRTFALGLYKRRTRKVVNLQECWLQSEAASRLLVAVRQVARQYGWSAWDERAHKGFLRNMVVREASTTQDLMVNLVTSRHDKARMASVAAHLKAEHPEVTTLVNTINSGIGPTPIGAASHVEFGPGTIKERVGPHIFEVAPASFFQSNTPQAEVLCDVIRTMGALEPHHVVWDLYCGMGLFAITIASLVRTVLGIELVPEAVRAARCNAAANGITNCTFVAADLRTAARNKGLLSGGHPDVVICDPPRAGMHPKVVRRLLALAPSRIVYASCNPRTQARDLAPLMERYDLKAMQPVDLFPQTPHIENVALLIAHNTV